MPTSFGKRARTRQKYSKPFRMSGMPAVSRYLVTYKKGDYVDIICDPSIQKGMPYSFYHGRTGVVFNVTPRAVGVEVKKVVGSRQLLKRLHVRIEHVRKSRCNELFLKRVKENDKMHHEAHLQGKTVKTKRTVQGPREGGFVEGDNMEVLEPAPFTEDY